MSQLTNPNPSVSAAKTIGKNQRLWIVVDVCLHSFFVHPIFCQQFEKARPFNYCTTFAHLENDQAFCTVGLENGRCKWDQISPKDEWGRVGTWSPPNAILKILKRTSNQLNFDYFTYLPFQSQSTTGVILYYNRNKMNNLFTVKRIYSVGLTLAKLLYKFG